MVPREDLDDAVPNEFSSEHGASLEGPVFFFSSKRRGSKVEQNRLQLGEGVT